MIELTSIGKLGKPYGVRGQLRLKLSREIDLAERKFLFIRILGDKVPYAVNSIDSDFVVLEEVDSPEEASKLAGREIYIESKYIDQDTQLSNPILGFQLFTGNAPVGVINDILQYPQQMMAVVSDGVDTHYIPIVESWIVEIDPEQKRIDMDLPDGILEINRDGEEE